MTDTPTNPQAQPQEDVPSRKLMVTLAGAGALAGLMIVFVYGWTQPTIQAYKARMLAAAIQEVLRAPAAYDTLYVHEGRVVNQPPEGGSTANLETLYLGYDADGSPIGYAIAAGEPGFQDIIGLIFGYDHRTGKVLGMKVLQSKETPGLGDKIEKDADFVAQFEGVLTPLLGVKSRDASADPHEIDMITGATISSRTIIRTINNAVERLGPMLDAYEEDAGP
jgi:electron transport complex protein RnfG